MAERRESKALESSAVVIAIILGAAALFAANEFFIPVTLSFVLTSLLWPVVQQLKRWHIPTAVGSVLAIVGTVAIFAAAIAAFEPPVRKFANEIPKSIAAARPKLAKWSESLSRMIGSPAKKVTAPESDSPSRADTTSALAPANAAATASTNAAANAPKIALKNATANAGAAQRVPASSNVDFSSISDGAPATLSHALGVASTLLGDFVEIMLLAMFILGGGAAWMAKLGRAVGDEQTRDAVVGTIVEMRGVVTRYITMLALINIVQGSVISIALYSLGYPTPWLWGILAFMLEFIPYFGGMVVIALLLVVGLASGRGFPSALAGPLVYFVTTSLQNNVVSPIAYGRQLRLNPTAILAGLMLWFMLWGVAGAFLAVPILAAFHVLAARIPALRSVNIFLGD